MKSVLYVGAALMIGASIYGFVDYKNTSHKKEFTGMYEEKKLAQPVLSHETEKKPEVTVATNTVTNKKAVNKKVAKKKASKIADDPIHAIKPVSKDEVMITDLFEIEDAEVDPAIAKNSEPEKKLKKKKKLNRNMFSRAPIREYEPIEKTGKKVTKKEL